MPLTFSVYIKSLNVIIRFDNDVSIFFYLLSNKFIDVFVVTNLVFMSPFNVMIDVFNALIDA